MESRIVKTLTVLGVPGVALGFFYLLLRQFGFTFSTVAPFASAAIAVMFLLIVGGITFYALYRWAPLRPSDGHSSDTSPGRLNIKDVRVINEKSGVCLIDFRVSNVGGSEVTINRVEFEVLDANLVRSGPRVFSIVYDPDIDIDIDMRILEDFAKKKPSRKVWQILKPGESDHFGIRLGFQDSSVTRYWCRLGPRLCTNFGDVDQRR